MKTERATKEDFEEFKKWTAALQSFVKVSKELKLEERMTPGSYLRIALAISAQNEIRHAPFRDLLGRKAS